MTQPQVNFDDVLERIGSHGRYQAYNIILMGLAGIPCGAYTLANAFIAGNPLHRCTDVTVNVTENNTTSEGFTSQSCYIQRGENGTNVTDSDRLPCTSWEYDRAVYEDTIVSEWDLVCSRAWLAAFSQSSYMFGFLIGCLGFGSLSDCIGRKKAWFISLLLMIVSGTTAAFMPDYWTFISMRALSGTAAAGAFTSGFVITMEVMGLEYRTKTGLFYQGWFAFGYTFLSLLAYFVRNFRHLQLVLGLIPIVFIPYYWLLGESARWLMTEGKMKEASIEVRKATKMNRTEYPEDLMTGEAKQMLLVSEKELPQKVDSKESHSGSFFDLWRTPNMRKKTMNACFNWMVNSMVFYGLSLGSSTLMGGPYINLFLSGVAEFTGLFGAMFTLDRFGRRPVISACLFVAGICCLIMTLIPPECGIITTVLSLLGKVCISASFAIIYVYHAELCPTVVRNVGVGTGSMCARIGGLLAPFISLLGNFWSPLPVLIFGVCSILAATLSLLLPETMNQKLPETIEDGELFGREGSCELFKCCRRNPNLVVECDADKTKGTVSKNNSKF